MPSSPSAPANRVVVIGAGFGGLAAAIRLQARGYRVTLVDKRDAPGGRGYVYRDAGYTFDAGPTLITAPWLITELFELAGRDPADYVNMVPLDPFYRIRFDDGTEFNYSGDQARMDAEVMKIAPADLDGFHRLQHESEAIYRKGYEELGDLPFHDFMSMLRVAPDLIKLGSYRTVYGLVASHVKSDKLRQVLSFHPLLIGGNPFHVTSIYALIHYLERKFGVWFAMGGTGAIVAAMARLFVELGGTLRVSTEIEEIVVPESGRRATGVRVRGSAEGEVIPCDILVSNADAGHTYRELIPARVRQHWTNDRIEGLKYSMGLFVAYFGLSRRHDAIAHHTIMLGPRYRGLLDDIFNKKVLADDFSLYVHRPTATDPSLAPPGGDTFYVLAPVPHLGGTTDWAVEGDAYRDRIYAFLERTMIPGLRRDLVTTRHVTPIHFREDLNSLYGAGFSVQPTLLQSAWFRPHNKSEELDNLFLVGAGTHPGAGMPGVLSTAKVVDRLIPRLPGDPGRDPIAGTHA